MRPTLLFAALLAIRVSGGSPTHLGKYAWVIQHDVASNNLQFYHCWWWHWRTHSCRSTDRRSEQLTPNCSISMDRLWPLNSWLTLSRHRMAFRSFHFQRTYRKRLQITVAPMKSWNGHMSRRWVDLSRSIIKAVYLRNVTQAYIVPTKACTGKIFFNGKSYRAIAQCLGWCEPWRRVMALNPYHLI
jgi:hypothetical protein